MDFLVFLVSVFEYSLFIVKFTILIVLIFEIIYVVCFIDDKHTLYIMQTIKFIVNTITSLKMNIFVCAVPIILNSLSNKQQQFQLIKKYFLSELNEFIKMKVNIILFILFIVAHSKVIPVTPDTFAENTKSTTFVKFFTPWCSHCIALKPIYEEVSEMFTNVTFIEVDCAKYEDFCQDHEIRGFPTLKLYKNSIIYNDFEGPRDKTNIIRFLTGQSYVEPETKVLRLNSSVFDSIVLDETKNVVVKFFKPTCNICKGIRNKYEQLVTIFKREKDLVISEFDCSKAENREICKGRYKIHSYPTITFFPKNFKTGKDFTSSHEVISYVNTINRAFGYGRQDNGELNSQYGTHYRLNKYSQGFMELSKNEMQKRIDTLDTNDKVKNLRFVTVYKDIMKRIYESDNNNVVATMRTELMEIRNHTQDIDKKENAKIKLNILNTFN